MGKTLDLTAADGHRLSAYLATPAGPPKGGIVVIQEIFGVTRHIRAVTDQCAAAGFTAVAPAMFDRVKRDADVPYTDVQTGVAYMQAQKIDEVMLDLRAAVDSVKDAGKVGVVGYCWGGTMAYLAAARLKVDAAVAYYGGGIQNHLTDKPKVPVLFHFGEKDTHIPLSAVDQIKTAYPQGVYHLYPAEHGFNCSDRASFDSTCSKLALERTLQFFHRYVG